MLHSSIVVTAVYRFLPLAAAVFALVQCARMKNANPLRELLMTAITGAVGGLILVTGYMRSFTGEVSVSQVAVACNWGIAVACAVRGFNEMLVVGLRQLMPKAQNGRPCCAGSLIAASVVRAVLLLGIGIPYVASMVLTYRPHMVHEGTPTSVLGTSYQDVRFESTDGMHLRGWWIPARAPAANVIAGPEWGQRTVILCHGFNGDKARDLGMVRDLIPGGFNILSFDFRAHGQSEGQLTTFGDLERRDVLGAVRWLQQNHAAESRKIFGLGEGLGAAALIAAAGDPNEGQAINAIAVFAPYDTLKEFLTDMANEHAVPMAGWLATRLALPIAGAQFGTDLAHFSPLRDVDKIAPRPLLVIAAENDMVVDLASSQTVYDEASQPKLSYWIKKGTRDAMLFKNAGASMSVRVFFETARNIL